ncbi:MAG: TonB-dependent receptor plug domain-containing protein [Nitrosomonas sp.]|nr:TonB-dependent receptor plug domain-containing protein [Nitrosomonas sp.]
MPVFSLTSLLQRVDVMRGPASAVWGSGALGGVISFTTLDATDLLRPG